MSRTKSRVRRKPIKRVRPARTAPPAPVREGAGPAPVYEEPGARNPDNRRVEGMSIDPKLEAIAGGSARPRRA